MSAAKRSWRADSSHDDSVQQPRKKRIAYSVNDADAKRSVRPQPMSDDFDDQLVKESKRFGFETPQHDGVTGVSKQKRSTTQRLLRLVTGSDYSTSEDDELQNSRSLRNPYASTVHGQSTKQSTRGASTRVSFHKVLQPKKKKKKKKKVMMKMKRVYIASTGSGFVLSKKINTSDAHESSGGGGGGRGGSSDDYYGDEHGDNDDDCIMELAPEDVMKYVKSMETGDRGLHIDLDFENSDESETMIIEPQPVSSHSNSERSKPSSSERECISLHGDEARSAFSNHTELKLVVDIDATVFPSTNDKDLVESEFVRYVTFVLRTLRSLSHSWVYENPVDPVALRIPEYHRIVFRPMSYSEVAIRVSQADYLRHALEDLWLRHDIKDTKNRIASLLFKRVEGLVSDEYLYRAATATQSHTNALSYDDTVNEHSIPSSPMNSDAMDTDLQFAEDLCDNVDQLQLHQYLQQLRQQRHCQYQQADADESYLPQQEDQPLDVNASPLLHHQFPPSSQQSSSRSASSSPLPTHSPFVPHCNLTPLQQEWFTRAQDRFLYDIRLIFSNALMFNSGESDIGILTKNTLQCLEDKGIDLGMGLGHGRSGKVMQTLFNGWYKIDSGIIRRADNIPAILCKKLGRKAGNAPRWWPPSWYCNARVSIANPNK